MVRTIISMSDSDKCWLDAQARASGKPMTALVREALALYRVQQENLAEPGLATLLSRTAGLRALSEAREDGLATQNRLRDEWGGTGAARPAPKGRRARKPV